MTQEITASSYSDPTPTKGMISEFIASQKEEEQMSGWDLFKNTFKDTTVTGALYSAIAEPSGNDLFEANQDLLREHASGIPFEYLEDIADSNSKAEFLYKIKNRIYPIVIFQFGFQ